MPLGTDVGLGPSHIVLDGHPGPLPPKKGAQPPSPHQFPATVYCGQTAEWIKMPLGTKVGLGSGDIVLDGDPAPPRKGHTANFRPMSIVAKRLDASGYPLVRT